jgi:hypothetical protein
LPVIRGDARRVRELAVSEQRGEIALVERRWKVALNQEGAAYLVTDLENDPEEHENLAGSAAARGVEAGGRQKALAFLLGTQLFDDWR